MHPCDNAEALLRVLDPPRRNAYFYGKRMDVQHFQMEQDYGKLKQWLLNRLTVGKGVLCGLQVSIDGDRLCIDPGVAIDGLGREIVVPTRACIDPVTQEGGCCHDPCCGERAPTPPPPPGRQPGDAPPGVPGAGRGPNDPPAGANPNDPGGAIVPVDPARRREIRGVFTLWACYRECRTDFQPVLVSECEARERCAPGTIVETYCLKVTPGLPPQLDPRWCARLWRHAQENRPQGIEDPQTWADLAPNFLGPCVTGTPPALPSREELRAALESYRHQLCMLFAGKCDPAEGDPCVPLAAFAVLDGRIRAIDECLVRPRLYSNAMLLDVILCLIARIDECCGEAPTPPTPPSPPPVRELLRVVSVEFLDGQNQVIAAVDNPNAVTKVPIRKQGRSIRVRFTGAFDQGAAKPTTAGLPAEPNFKRHNVLVVPEGGPRFGFDYVPGMLTIEAPDTIRFDVNPESRFFDAQLKGWQKGALRLRIFGDDDSGIPRRGMADVSGTLLDGNPIVPAGGVISGDGTPGGEFTCVFNVAP